MAYYDDKLVDLRRLFGTNDIAVGDREIRVAGREYDIIDDVIILLPPDRRPPGRGHDKGRPQDIAAAVQRTFGREWVTFDEILPEHREEFDHYFDLIDKESLAEALVGDLGCGIGRYSSMLAPWCRRLVLVDFSVAIFVARRNLAGLASPIFIMGDIARLPWAEDALDFAFSLGVLHHLPTDALDAVRSLRRLSPWLLIYLYYAVENRPAHFRALLRLVTFARSGTSRIRNERARRALTTAIARGVYQPLIRLGHGAERFGLERMVPLADTYKAKSLQRIRQDVYDRFFTPVEQRFSRRQIEGLSDDFSSVTVSDSAPFWHFECRR